MPTFTGETNVPITAGSGTPIDVAVPTGSTNERQVVATGSASHAQDVHISRASGALGALNAAVTLPGWDVGTLMWQIDTGTLVGTVVFEYTLDDTNWIGVVTGAGNQGVVYQDGDPIPSAGLTAFGVQGFVLLAASQVRMRVSAYTSGTSNARLMASPTPDYVRIERLPKGSANSTPGAVSVGTSATLILAANKNRKFASLYNAGTATVYIGGSGVSVAAGYPVPANTAFNDGDGIGAWYGIVSVGTQSVTPLEIA